MATSSVSPKRGKVIDIPANAPTIGTATDGNESASITFTAISDTTTGGPVSFYRATSNPGSITGTSTSTPIVVSGLTNGTAYTFTVAGVNATGRGPLSGTSNSVTPEAKPRFLMYFIEGAGPSGVSYITYKDNNYYTNGQTSWIYTKYNDFGVAQSLKGKFASFPAGEVPYWVGLDSANNIYIGGTAYGIPSSTYGTEIVKMNSSGAIQWQKNMYSTQGVFPSRGAAFTIDSSDNVYFSASSYDNPYTGFASALTVKLNSSGAVQWQRELRPTSASVQNRAIAVDASGNVYSSFDVNSNALIAKYNSSGTLQWQKSFASAVPNTGMVVDSAGNLYVAFQQTVSSNRRATLMKLNSSGVVQWQRFQDYGGSHNEAGQQSLAIDSSDNIYIYGRQVVGRLWVAKYDTSGTIQWKRQTSSTEEFTPKAITTRSNTEFAIAWTDSAGASYVFAVPTDGSVTGTYTINGKTFTYEVGTFSEGAAGITDSTASFTSNTTSIPITNSSLTTAAVTLTTSTQLL
jgi:hypothetical protein